MHYSRQYIHRANVVAVLMEIYERHGRVLHPFGSSGSARRYGPIIKAPSTKRMLASEYEQATTMWGKPQSLNTPTKTPVWSTVNFLDSNIHQAAFHFLRAQKLVESDFFIEAVVAFDCSLQAVGAFLGSNGHFSGSPSRREICEFLGFDVDHQDLAEYGYFLRNNFGAHAGGWRWWDQSEMVDDETIIELGKIVKKTLLALAKFERSNRVIEQHPKEWSIWFFQNFQHIWNSIWFEKQAKWVADLP